MYPVLETERLILRSWQLGDEKRILDFADILNSTIPKNEIPQINNINDAFAVLQSNIDDDNQWAIIYKEGNILIGWFGLAAANKRSIRENAVIWIWLDENYHNRGICTEAVEKVLNFAFFGVKTKQIYANCKNKITAMNKVLIKFGFTKYNIIPKNKPNNENSVVQYKLSFFDYDKREYETKYDYQTPPEIQENPYSYENPIRKIDSINYLNQPTEYLCGQAVIAMLANVKIVDVIIVMNNNMGVSISQMRETLKYYGIKTKTVSRQKYTEKTVLPNCCILSVKLPEYGHWSLYYMGKYYDPEFGLIDELPERAKLISFWEIMI